MIREKNVSILKRVYLGNSFPETVLKQTQRRDYELFKLLNSMLCTFVLVHCLGFQTTAQDRSVRYKIESPLETQASFNKIQQKSNKPIMVAYMPPATEFNYYLDIGKGIRSVCSVTGDKSFMFAPQSDNPSEQMKMIQEVIRQKVDAIILSTHDPKSAASYVKRAVDQGILVLIVNSDTPRFSTPVHAVVGYIQRAGTHKIGRYILEILGGNEKVKVGVIEGAPGYHSTERVGGFLDAIKETNFKVVSSLNGKWNTEGGNMAALKMFKAHPDIKVVFAANDFEIIGAVSALKTLNINNVFLLGNDGDPATFERIADERITATVNTDPVLIGKVAMQVVLDSISGKFKGGFVETPTIIVDDQGLNFIDKQDVILCRDDDKELYHIRRNF